ncbi:MAG: hypothetical protein IPI73_02440 [Betaproteobacteria bacterium]|nr:hypothetical protein [Betaproteobacteria bacterium]
MTSGWPSFRQPSAIAASALTICAEPAGAAAASPSFSNVTPVGSGVAATLPNYERRTGVDSDRHRHRLRADRIERADGTPERLAFDGDRYPAAQRAFS